MVPVSLSSFLAKNKFLVFGMTTQSDWWDSDKPPQISRVFPFNHSLSSDKVILPASLPGPVFTDSCFTCGKQLLRIFTFQSFLLWTISGRNSLIILTYKWHLSLTSTADITICHYIPLVINKTLDTRVSCSGSRCHLSINPNVDFIFIVWKSVSFRKTMLTLNYPYL